MTELNLEFEVENPELPLEVDRTGLSFFKASVKNYSSEWFEELYEKEICNQNLQLVVFFTRSQIWN